MLLIWVLCAGLGLSKACSRKYVDDVVVTHFDRRGIPKCKGSGQRCKYDRNCCAGLECKMAVEGIDIISICQYRKVYENYVEVLDGPVWKDYQELESSEEKRIRQFNVEELVKRNLELKRKLAELKSLRKSVRRQQLLDTKRALEEVEVEELKKEQLKYGEEFNEEVDRLRAKDLENLLEELEKNEVNHTLSKQQRVADLYMNMLADLVDKGEVQDKPIAA